ncbi:MAG: PAS domain S-box protein [Planctomycetes bacterium]|nr:PAS domain S-box protein [Planctomycetota bacterium]
MEQSNRDRMKSLFDQELIGVAFVEAETGRFLEVNGRMCEILGYPENELIRLDFRTITHPGDIAVTNDLYGKFLDGTQKTLQIEKRYVRGDGTIVWGHVTVLPMEGIKNETRSNIVFVSDITNKKRTEEALDKSEKFVRVLLDSIPDLLFRLDSDGTMLDYAGKKEELALPPETFLGKSIVDILPRDISSLGLDKIRESLRTKEYQTLEYTLNVPLPDGPPRHFESRYIPISDTEVVSIVRNITSLKQMEKDLRRSESRYRNVIETSHEAFGELDLKGNMIAANERFFDLFGYAGDELRGKHVLDFLIFPEDREKMRIRLKDRLSKKTELYEQRFRKKDGGELYLLVSGAPLVDEAGNVYGSFAMMTDITAFKKIEKDLRQSEERFRSIFETAHDGIAIIDPETLIIVDANQKYCEMLGYAVEEMKQLQAKDMTSEEELTAATERIRSSASGEAKNGEGVPLRRKDGTIFYADITNFRFILEGRTYLAGFFRDVTDRIRAERERRELERQFQQAQKFESLGVLAGGIAHDFNNLLLAIMGSAELAALSIEKGSDADQNVQRIIKTSKRAAEIVSQMLAYTGKGSFIAESVNLNALVSEMGYLLKVSIGKNVSLDFELGPDVPNIDGDSTQIRQVVLNLLTNASEAIGGHSGSISVETGVKYCDEGCVSSFHSLSISGRGKTPGVGDYVFIEVSDTGCGMDDATISKMFDPFFTTKFTGRGLGLSASLGIVRAHGGAVSIESAEGEGSRIRVYFPVPKRKSEPTGLSEEDRDALKLSGGETVLVVDDDRAVLEIATRMAEKLGFEVLSATGGEDAIRIFEKRADEISVVLLDLTMPEVGGFETFIRLREIRSDARIVLASGFDEQHATERFRGKRLAGFIKKPYELSELRRVIIGALDF